MIKIKDLQQLSELIKKERKRQKLTQLELAAAAGVGIRFIVDLEKGKSTCQIGKSLRVLYMLGIPLSVEEIDQ